MATITHILEKGSSPVNEDRLLITPSLFGVFDGATSLSPAAPSQPEEPGILPEKYPLGEDQALTGGAMAAALARETFSRNHYPLTRLALDANAAISRQMQAHGIGQDRSEQVWSTSAAVVRITNEKLEWFRTGDAQVILIFRDGSHRALGHVKDHDYPTLAMMKAQEDNTLDNPVLRRQVLKVRKGMNQTYGVLNGDDRAPAFFNSGTVPLTDVASVLIFTDGLTLPSHTPSPRPDFTPLVKNFRALGLHGLHRKIRHLEKTDKHRRKYPRFKCHDDIAAVAVSFEPENTPLKFSGPAL